MRFLLLIAVILPAVFAAFHKQVKPHGAMQKNYLKSVAAPSTLQDKELKTSALVNAFPTNPTYGTVTTYSDSSCSSIILQETFLLNQCFLNNDGTGSTLFTCGNNGYTMSSYTSNDCTGTPSDLTLPSTCTNVGNGQFAQGTSCGTSGVEWSTDDMFVQTYYDGSQTCSSNIAHVIGSKVNYCFNEDSVDSSQIKDYTYKYWSGNTVCSGSPSFTVAIPKTCTLDGTNDNDDFDGGFYVSFVSHGAAMSNIALNFTVLISTMMVTVLALFKN